MLKLDAASDANHERLGVFSETFEDSNQITQSLVNFCGVEDGFLREVTQNLQLLCNVFERNALQLGSPL